MLASVAGWITAAISASGYAGIVVLMALESACLPVPSEVVMPFAGYLASTGRFSLFGVALAGAVGCNLGSTAAYVVGARGGAAFVRRWGRYVFLDEADLQRAHWFFARFGMAAVLVGRLLPMVRTFIALPAGIGHMRQVPFQVLTFVGSLIWCYALAAIGAALGRAWDHAPWLSRAMHGADLLVALVAVAALVWFVATRLRRRRA